MPEDHDRNGATPQRAHETLQQPAELAAMLTAAATAAQAAEGQETHWPESWMGPFLAALKAAPVVRYAARAAGVHYSTCYRRRSGDAEFARAWDESLPEAVDDLEQLAFTIAKRGDGQMIKFLLQAHRKEIYGPKAQVEHSGRVTVTPDTHLSAMRELLGPEQYAIYEHAFLGENTPALGSGDTLEAEYRVEGSDWTAYHEAVRVR